MNAYTFGPFSLFPDRFVLACNGFLRQRLSFLKTSSAFELLDLRRVVDRLRALLDLILITLSTAEARTSDSIQNPTIQTQMRFSGTTIEQRLGQQIASEAPARLKHLDDALAHLFPTVRS